jgi:hypothetical protein
MPLRFYRRVRLIPGIRLNASRGGVSLSMGHRGAWFTVGPRGRRVSVGWPKRSALKQFEKLLAKALARFKP